MRFSYFVIGGMVTLAAAALMGGHLLEGLQGQKIALQFQANAGVDPAFYGQVAVRALALSPDGNLMVWGTSTGVIKVGDAAGEVESVSFPAHSGMVYALSFSPDSKLLASIGGSQMTETAELKIWETSSWRLQTTLATYRYPMYCLAFSPDGKRLAAPDGDCGVHIHDLSAESF